MKFPEKSCSGLSEECHSRVRDPPQQKPDAGIKKSRFGSIGFHRQGRGLTLDDVMLDHIKATKKCLLAKDRISYAE